MSLDAICLRAVLGELRDKLIGARVDKVQQPTRDQIVLLVRGNQRVLLSANPNQPRIQLTSRLRDNPAQPPMFCMLLRKHLVGARIEAIEQPDLERVVTIDLRVTDELGETGRRKLVLEAMGRRANLLLLDAEGRIVDCLRRVAFESNSDRALLPGLFYHLPTPLEKLSLLSDADAALALFNEGGAAEERAEQWLVDRFVGISPLVARELVQRAAGDTDMRFCEMNASQREALRHEAEALATRLRENDFTPTMLLRGGRPVDFTYLPVTQYGAETAVETRETFSELLDEFYDLRERQELSARRGKELSHAATVARDRMARKCETLKKEYAATQDRDKLRLCGDLITANLYRMDRGAASFTTENFYEESQPSVTIALDPLLTPQQNAAKYYKRYNKAKSAEVHLREQIEKAEAERAYLDSVLQEIAQSETEQEFSEIRHELQETGYLRRGKDKKELKRSFAPREYRSCGGARILVGRNNVQNDQLTLKKADKRDIWFHAQKIHGSHVILCTDGTQPDERSMEEAAMLAAYFSQAREGANVPVDYTPVKYVKKPAGARPGMVVYETYRTMYVTPKADELPPESRK
ncbi:MAG: fibronectin/fibrinogen-binding protein [Ruminococcaceae bacterium]|nr:fibronectin/fibrinogen-binding protein [Oscillospiraceae bacterium]